MDRLKKLRELVDSLPQGFGREVYSDADFGALEPELTKIALLTPYLLDVAEALAECPYHTQKQMRALVAMSKAVERELG